MKNAVQLIEQSSHILVAGHLRADGDSLGSAIVIARALRALGRRVQLLMPDPPDGRYQFLYQQTPWQLYGGPGSLPEHDLLIVCDCSQLDRLGEMGAELISSSTKRMVIDHHPFDRKEHHWDAEVHDTQAAATGILAVAFSRELGIEVDTIALEAAFVALMTDTGWLKYSNADAAAYQAAADFVAGGVDPDRIYRMIYQQTESGTPRGIGTALQSCEFLAEGRVALGWVSDQALAQADGVLIDTDEVLDIMRAVHTVEGVAFLSERKGRVKVSFRSKTWLDVNRVARQVGGGGHARAAGATFPEQTSLAQACEQVRHLMQQAIAEQGAD
jgi:bifunctional oligoribonuclease and PAP phosphatase NrnA